MRIAFTGHRDRRADPADLDTLAAAHPDPVWVHGGAIGFDRQVGAHATSYGIRQVVIRPDYARFGRGAPLRRNHDIIADADLLVALYDGRSTGGTLYTIKIAKAAGLTVQILRPTESDKP